MKLEIGKSVGLPASEVTRIKMASGAGKPTLLPISDFVGIKENTLVPHWIRYFNRDILNRMVLRSAGSRMSKFAVARHVGRHSGRLYETPLLLVPMGEDFVIALTYWPRVDWYHNLHKAGTGTFRSQGKIYAVGHLEVIDQAIALPAFSPVQRFGLRLLKVRHFARVTLMDLEAQKIGK